MLSIRAATIADVPLLKSLIQELAEYERESQEVLGLYRMRASTEE
jgi:N-acetylglutamate synthase-like GNAT family acetyltransferase